MQVVNVVMELAKFNIYGIKMMVKIVKIAKKLYAIEFSLLAKRTSAQPLPMAVL